MTLINETEISMGKFTVIHGSTYINYIFLINDLEVSMMDILNEAKENKKKLYKFFLIMPEEIMDK
jgi:hypothetical protein